MDCMTQQEGAYQWNLRYKSNIRVVMKSAQSVDKDVQSRTKSHKVKWVRLQSNVGYSTCTLYIKVLVPKKPKVSPQSTRDRQALLEMPFRNNKKM